MTELFKHSVIIKIHCMEYGMGKMKGNLDQKLIEQILAKLGLLQYPRTNLEGLQQIYSAWCRRIPFDNIRKLIHLNTENPDPLPGCDPVDFFVGWLKDGTGGTCWAGSEALFTLFRSLGFEAERGVASMLTRPVTQPDHGTVIVVCAGKQYLTDTSILHGLPLLLEGETTVLDHSAWGISGERLDGSWHIRWRPLHELSGLTCRLEYIGASRKTFLACNEATRHGSLFNRSLYVRQNQHNSVFGIAFGQRLVIDSSEKVQGSVADASCQADLLTRQFGISREVSARIPTCKFGPFS